MEHHPCLYGLLEFFHYCNLCTLFDLSFYRTANSNNIVASDPSYVIAPCATFFFMNIYLYKC